MTKLSEIRSSPNVMDGAQASSDLNLSADDCVIGSAGATKLNAPVALPGPRPQFFFAPNQIAKRNTDWGPAEFNRRYGEAERAFFARAADPANPWMRVVEHAGFDAAAGVIADLHAGRADPLEGHIVVLD